MDDKVKIRVSVGLDSECMIYTNSIGPDVEEAVKEAVERIEAGLNERIKEAVSNAMQETQKALISAFYSEYSTALTASPPVHAILANAHHSPTPPYSFEEVRDLDNYVCILEELPGQKSCFEKEFLEETGLTLNTFRDVAQSRFEDDWMVWWHGEYLLYCEACPLLALYKRKPCP